MKKIAGNPKGFTLAEVLITLGIIGIVASMTIPTLIENYQKTQYITGLKKAYAEVTEALKLMANDHGCPDDLLCVDVFDPAIDTSMSSKKIGNEFKKYFKLSKDCGNLSELDTGCWADKTYYYYDKSSPDNFLRFDTTGLYDFLSADGMSYALDGAPCANLHGLTGNNTKQICGELYVDVNGKNGPNAMGRDTFSFYITNGKGPAIYPEGGPELLQIGWGWRFASGQPVSCNKLFTNGSRCAARIMEEGWQMNY